VLSKVGSLGWSKNVTSFTSISIITAVNSNDSQDHHALLLDYSQVAEQDMLTLFYSELILQHSTTGRVLHPHICFTEEEATANATTASRILPVVLEKGKKFIYLFV
jgi:hypothetical protein